MASTSDSFRARRPALLMTARQSRMRRVGNLAGQGFLLLVTCLSMIAVLFIFYFIGRDAMPFFHDAAGAFSFNHVKEFFTSKGWYPTGEPQSFGALAIMYGSVMVTLGAMVVAVPLGVSAAVCLSDVLSFRVRQTVKPVIEILAAIPSVVYGFFALIVLAPYMQRQDGSLLAVAVWIVFTPLLALAAFVLADVATDKLQGRARTVRLDIANRRRIDLSRAKRARDHIGLRIGIRCRQ